MKGMFIFGQESPKDWIHEIDWYQFVPYHFGPCSFAIYNDLERLDFLGYVRSEMVPEKSWKNFAITPMGIEEAQGAKNYFKPEIYLFLKKIRNFVSNLSFDALLKSVYKAYPEFAEKSVFREKE